MATLTALPSGLDGAGLICWWELSGRVDPEALAEALDDEGYTGAKPPVTTPRTALSQAMKQVAGRRASRVHGVLALQRDQTSWFLVEKHLIDGGADVALAAYARIEVDGDDYKIVKLGDRSGSMSVADAIVAAARALKSTSATWSLSSWICAAHVKTLRAVSLRIMGGFYYVPPSSRRDFDAFWRAIKTVSAHQVSTIDALPTSETIAAVGAALRREYNDAIASLETDINSGDAIGKRAKQTKIAHCEALREKLTAYTGLLGTTLNDVDDAMASLGAALAMVPEEA